MVLLETVLQNAPGLSIGVFDRALRYTAIFGGASDLRAVGRTVGSMNPEAGDHIYEAARLAIHTGETTIFDVRYGDKTFEVRVQPLQDPHFGIIGGVCWGVDVTHRVDSK